MKNISLLTLLLFTQNIVYAQNESYSNISWLQQTDIVVGNEIMRLGVKEIYEDSQMKYWFKVSINESTDATFEILANDFREGEYLNTLFFTKIKNIYQGFPIPDLEVEDKRELSKLEHVWSLLLLQIKDLRDESAPNML